MTPRLVVGVRHDGGDAETGFGADIGGGVTLAAPAQGLTVSLEGRGVLTHEAAGLRERGFAGTLAWDPPPSTGRGPKLTLSQSLGAGASGGKNELLSRTGETQPVRATIGTRSWKQLAMTFAALAMPGPMVATRIAGARSR